MSKVTINDVAEESGFSVGTVSAVINNRSTVRPSTREQVLAVIEALGYRPSSSARALRTPQVRRDLESKTVGLIVKEADNPYFDELMLGVRQYLEEKGFALFTSTSEGSYKKEGDLIEAFQAKLVDGLIITPILDEHADLSHLFMLKRLNFPFVLIGDVRGLQASVVDIDNVRASQRAVEYLIRAGHTRIVHVAGPPYSQHTQDRILGVQKAFSKSQLVYSDDIILPGGAHLEDGYRAGMTFFGEREKRKLPMAVTCFNDQVAIGLMRALVELGLRIPEDVSVVGHDDIRTVQYLMVSLTTIRSPHQEMGRKAAELLVKQIEAGEPLPPEKVVLNTELIIRDSTRSVT